MKYPVGKKVGEHLYLHVSLLDEDADRVSRDIRAKVMRAWSVVERTPVVSTIPNETWDIVKLHLRLNEVTFLWYPDFFSDPHPGLNRSLRVVSPSLTPVTLTFWNQFGVDTPILHRKELFLAQDHTFYCWFANLTRQEEKAGLYFVPSTIGRRGAWKRLLREKKLYIREHVLYHKEGGRV